MVWQPRSYLVRFAGARRHSEELCARWCDPARVIAVGHLVTTMSSQNHSFCEWILAIAYDEEILQEYSELAYDCWEAAVEVIMGIANTDTQLPIAFSYEQVDVDIDTDYAEYCKVKFMEEDLRDDLVFWICRVEPDIESRAAEAMKRYLHQREAMVCIFSTVSFFSQQNLQPLSASNQPHSSTTDNSICTHGTTKSPNGGEEVDVAANKDGC